MVNSEKTRLLARFVHLHRRIQKAISSEDTEALETFVFEYDRLLLSAWLAFKDNEVALIKQEIALYITKYLPKKRLEFLKALAASLERVDAIIEFSRAEKGTLGYNEGFQETVNFKLIAIQLGEGVKYDTTINEITRVANAIFDFERKPHSAEGITSSRSGLVYDWVMTLSEQPIDDGEKLRLLDEFVSHLTPADSPLRNLTRSSEDRRQPKAFWPTIHPAIVRTAKKRFEDGHFADAVESAFKAVNKRVKDYVKGQTGEERDGAALMNFAFSLKAPIITFDNLKTRTGQDIQQGYMQIFAGSMTGIRNPKAHDNITIDEAHVTHLLFLATLLMFKLDVANVP